MEVDKALDLLRRRLSGEPTPQQPARPAPSQTQNQPSTPKEPNMAVTPSAASNKDFQMPAATEFSKVLDDCFEGVEMEKIIKDSIKRSLRMNFEQHTATVKLRERLSILFEYEKSYLSLVKEYKEEIKFIGTLQEDLRKERAKFFSDTLKEVSESLRDAQVASDVASQWIKELVDSYTRSLDLSTGLVEEQTVDTMGQIRKQAKEAVQTAVQSDTQMV